MEKLQQLPGGITVEQNHSSTDEEADVQLMRMARTLHAAVITDDFNLSKAARLTGIRVLNLNELANALRTTVAAGDELQVMIVKEGKEREQGVGYLNDGTMIVVDGGRAHMNETIPVVVSSALQTNAGRMIFAKAV